ncbi:2-hydroxyacid dehydrogenase [Atopomonas hussainii]|uniref:2-hydroxyacid dehydrogenase n=1 Tax=Atopomonas hussainii TaxID=1429083 RepID=UPI0009004CEE|nr:2-hydroxyacid dehydrogenase [Atopomonas hussainii]
MRVLLYSCRPYDRDSFEAVAADFPGIDLHFTEAPLTPASCALAEGFSAICTFVNDPVDASTLRALQSVGVRAIALRCAGFNQVDLPSAAELGISIMRVPAYSPYAVAEHAVGLILTLNRRIHRAFNRTREGDFSLHGLLGFDVHSKTVGVVGTGKIGRAFSQIMLGFGCKVLACDPQPDTQLAQQGVHYCELPALLEEADIVSLHCPLTNATEHLINQQRLATMKRGAMLINTSRGALVDTKALIAALKSGQLGHVGLDVYEEEASLFFADHSDHPLQDDVLARLLTFPNVIVTAHQAFFTQEAIHAIASTTLGNLHHWQQGQPCNQVHA